MNEEEYGNWIDELVAQGVYTAELAEDFKIQRSLFESEFRARIEDGDDQLPGAVGFVADEPIEMDGAPRLVARAAAERPGRAIYFEALYAGLG